MALVQMRPIRRWLTGLVFTSASVAVCYFWIDRSIALWVHHHFQLQYQGPLSLFSHWPDPLIPLAIVSLVALGLRAAARRKLPRQFDGVLFVTSVAVLSTEVIKNELKLIFGRTWPTSWMGDNPSFIKDGLYGFHFFQAGPGQSFPSGHMAAACAVLGVFWIYYPRWRSLYTGAGLLLGGCLVLTNFHFLSDVIAGAFLGASMGWIAATVWGGLVPSGSKEE